MYTVCVCVCVCVRARARVFVLFQKWRKKTEAADRATSSYVITDIQRECFNSQWDFTLLHDATTIRCLRLELIRF